MFKEKIQNIVDNVQLVTISRIVHDEDLQFTVRATLDGQGINSFPIKFYSVYKHFTERTFCKNDGCGTRVNIQKVVNDGGNTFLKAVVDMKTFEKYFTYRLDEKLFSRLGMLNVTFKTKIEKKQKVKIKNTYQSRQTNNYKPQIRYESQVRREADNMDALMQRELRGIRGNRPRVRYCSADGRYNSCRNSGNLNFNIGFGW
tara:strand:- start:69 stop:671 length:603 start_codon:yes stop_codon:yes gene_type:complete